MKLGDLWFVMRALGEEHDSIITYLQPTKQGEGCERSPLPTQH